jgi:phosphonate transport system substrate-binding protein
MRYLKFLIPTVLAVMMLTAATACAPQTPTPTNNPPSSTTTATAPANSTATPSAAPTEAPSYKDTVKELVVCYLPGEGTEQHNESRNLLHDELSEFLGIKVTEINAADYNAVVEAMRTKKADVAGFGPVSYVQAVDRAGAEALVIACPEGDKTLAGYTSKIIVAKDSDIKSLDDLRGRTFAFVDPSSTSGNYVPTLELMNAYDMSNEDFHTNGVFFSSVMFSGSHPNSILAVVNGDVDAAAVASNTLAIEIAQGRVSEDDFIVIHESPVIPGSPTAVRSDLPEDLKAKLKEFYLNYHNEEYFKNIAGISPEMNPSFAECSDSDYDYVRDLMAKVMPQ